MLTSCPAFHHPDFRHRRQTLPSDQHNLDTCRFMTVKLRARNPECVACGEGPTMTAASLPGYDYQGFTGEI